MMHTHTLTPRNLFAAAACLLAMHSIAQSTGDYRSAGSGDWSDIGTWQRFNGSSFVAAPSAPDAVDGVITIRVNHTVTRSGDISIDQVVVEAGGALDIQSSTFTLLDGPGVDLQILGSCSFTNAALSGPGLAQVASGGVLSITNGGLSATSIVSVLTGGTVNASGSGTVSALGTINNAGIWNMQGGNLGQPSFSGGPCAFNNLPGGVVNLNGWASTTNSWHQVTNNQGTFNKNNGVVVFTFSNDFSGKSFNNLAGGVLNVATGECVFNLPTTNEGSMTGGGGSLIKVDGGSSGGFLTNQPGGTVSTALHLVSGTLNLNGALNLSSFTVSGGGVNGPEAITIPNGGSFTWTGGFLGTTTAINIGTSASATFNGPGQLEARGTINNAGTVTMLGGGISGGPNQPATFNNLPNAVVNLNGWTTSATPWAMITNNQGTFTKNNGAVAFTFGNDFSGKAFNNLAGGVLNVATGECVFSVPTFNEGSMTGGAGSLIKVDGSASGGFFTNQPGGTVTTAFHLVSSNLNINGALSLGTFTVSGGGINGPEAISITNGGAFTWTGGVLGTTAVINIGAGANATFNGGLEARGTINNSGTVTMIGGGISGGPNQPATFNNLPNAVVNLNGWTTNVPAWHMVTNNQGTFNKNNGTELFTFGNDFSGKSFTNLAGGVVSVNSGTLAFNLPFPLQNGTFNVVGGTTLTGSEPFNFAGPAVVNNGSITTPVLRYQGTNAQQLNGSGSINNLAIDNAAGVDLGGEQTVTNALTLTSGQLRLGANDLFVENNAVGAVSGGNAISWVENTGSGSLHRQVNGSSYLFPVGTESYTPLTLSLTNGAQDRFSVRVQDGVNTEYSAPGVTSGTSISSDIVGRTWVVSEEITGGNEADVTLQWNGADELSLFGRNACTVSNYSGSDWNIGPLAPASGGDPFTRTLSGITAFRELCVTDGDAPLNDISTGLSDETSGYLKVFPVPASDVLHVSTPDGGSIIQVTLIDGTGRRVETRSTLNMDRSILDVSGLQSGTYVLELIDDREQVMRTQVIIAH
jgi:predicted lipoprotein with Yx(FWY)xxD motif